MMAQILRTVFTGALVAVLALGLCGITNEAQAASARVLRVRVDETMDSFRQQVPDASAILRDAEGILVFPRVYQAGLLGIGGEYGEGALLVNGRVVDYYRITSGSLGFQLGGQRKSLIIAFLTPKALQQFRDSSGWEVGADASVAVLTVGAEGKIDTRDLTNTPVVAFVIDQRGLMYNLSLEGSKITRIKK